MSVSGKNSLAIIGIDGMCPRVFEYLSGKGDLPVLNALMKKGQYSRMRVTTPPQSPVSWTTIATGLNPGSHGIFDFLCRNPNNYIPDLAILRIKSSLKGMEYVPVVRAKTFFESAAEHGISSRVIRWPMMFPAPKIDGCQILSGLGVPDIRGTLGRYAFYTTDPAFSPENKRGSIITLSYENGGQVQTYLQGPMAASIRGPKEISVPMTIAKTAKGVKVSFPDGVFELEPGEWGPIFSVKFSMGFMMKATGVFRAYLQSVEPYLNLFFLPIQIHPKETHIPISFPDSFASELWDACGPYLTLGMPEHTNALNDGCISEKGFLKLCEDVLAERERMIYHALETFERGIFACVFDTLDRIQHMFMKHNDPDGRYRNIINEWYIKMDDVVGRIMSKLEPKTHVLILSDHGFSPIRYNVHLNSWFVQEGYMKLKKGNQSGRPLFEDVDWDNTKAYALGLNSIYLNLKGREGKGIVDPKDAANLKIDLAEGLNQWHHPEGLQVMYRLHLSEEIFEGDYSSNGPDLVTGYSDGFRASWESAVGAAPSGDLLKEIQEPWGADHCCDPTFVPGVLFCSEKILPPDPSVYDIRPLVSSLIGEDL